MKPRPKPVLNISPYAGRWIALIRQRVSGVGRTAREALALSKTARPKEEPIVVFVPESFVEDKKTNRPEDKQTK